MKWYVALYLLSTLMWIGAPGLASDKWMTEPVEISITNTSKHDLQIIGVRLLNEAHDQWSYVDAQKRVLSVKQTMTFDVTYRKMSDNIRIFQIAFKRPLTAETSDKCGENWGELEYTSDYRVQPSSEHSLIKVVIADKRV